MQIRWLTVFFDFPGAGFDRGTAFWREVTGSGLSPFRGPGGEFATLLPPGGDAYLRVQRLQEGPARYHLDLHVDLTAESLDAARALDNAAAGAVALGGTIRSREEGEVIVVDSPGGFTFCLVPWDGETQVPAPLRVAGTATEAGTEATAATSRVFRLFLDIPADGFERECGFWSTLTGWALKPAPLPGYAFLDQGPGIPVPVSMVFQRRERSAPGDRVTAHVDFSVQNRDQITAQHQSAGARVYAEHSGWTVMTDPAGHAYCLCSC